MVGWVHHYVGRGAYVSCMYKSNDNTLYNMWLVTVKIPRLSMQHAEIYSYFVPILDRQTDGRTDGQTLNPCWSGVTRG